MQEFQQNQTNQTSAGSSPTPTSPLDNWGIADPAQSFSWASIEENQDQPDNYQLILSWFEAQNIRAGNPEQICQSYIEKQRENVRVNNLNQSIKLSSSALLERRSKLPIKI